MPQENALYNLQVFFFIGTEEQERRGTQTKQSERAKAETGDNQTGAVGDACVVQSSGGKGGDPSWDTEGRKKIGLQIWVYLTPAKTQKLWEVERMCADWRIITFFVFYFYLITSHKWKVYIKAD